MVFFVPLWCWAHNAVWVRPLEAQSYHEEATITRPWSSFGAVSRRGTMLHEARLWDRKFHSLKYAPHRICDGLNQYQAFEEGDDGLRAPRMRSAVKVSCQQRRPGSHFGTSEVPTKNPSNVAAV